MSLLSSFRPTLPPIRDVFRDELSSKVDPSSKSPSLTPAQTWSCNYQETRPLPVQHPGRITHLIYGPPFRYSDTEFRKTPCNTLLRNRRLSNEDIVSLQVAQPGPSSSFLTSPKHAYQVLMQNPPYSIEPRHLRSISMFTDTEDAEAVKCMPVARHNSGASLAPTHPPSLTNGVQHELEKKNYASYECAYCGKVFNRPSSLKIHSNSHTGEKPFVCTVQDCGRSFSVLSNMRRHARVHTSQAVPAPDKPSTCSLALSSSIQPHR